MLWVLLPQVLRSKRFLANELVTTGRRGTINDLGEGLLVTFPDVDGIIVGEILSVTSARSMEGISGGRNGSLVCPPLQRNNSGL